MNYQLAEKYFEESNYDLSFSIFKKIAEDELVGPETRSNSFNMMGVIISGFAPHMDLEDDHGVKYYKKAIEFDPNHIGALLNIVDTFGSGPSMHEEKELLNKSLKQLINNCSDKLSDDELSRIKQYIPIVIDYEMRYDSHFLSEY